jgi:uncharacterized protein YcbK (DUF882 family)
VVRGLAALVLALIALGLVSASVASAKRAPLPSLVAADDPSQRTDEDPSSAWGAEVALGESVRGLPYLGLRPLRIFNINTEKFIDVRLYDLWGNVDPSVASELDGLLCDSRNPNDIQTTVLDRRTLQLVFRAAYHFHARKVTIISAYRKPGVRKEGQHATGKAIDFRLNSASAGALAAYLRTFSRVGVGVYTNPDTQYVHLDVRDPSYYWIDASPPGRTWRERSLGGAGISKRDASYDQKNDWPEGTHPPSTLEATAL